MIRRFQSQVRSSRKMELFNGLSDPYTLEARTLMTASLVADLNKVPDATLMYDSGKTQFYHQGNSLVAVEDGVSKVILTGKSLGFSWNLQVGGVGDSVVIENDSNIDDIHKNYIYNFGDAIATESDFSLKNLIHSGSSGIHYNPSINGTPKIYDFSAHRFADLSPPTPDSYFLGIQSVGHNKYIMSIGSPDYYSYYFFDASSMTYEEVSVVETFPTEVKIVESQAIAFLLAGNNVYKTDGTAAGTARVFSAPTTIDHIQAVEFGANAILSCSVQQYDYDVNDRVDHEYLMVVDQNPGVESQILFDSDQVDVDFPSGNGVGDGRVVKLFESSGSVLCQFRGSYEEPTYYYRIEPDNSVHAVAKMISSIAASSDGTGNFYVDSGEWPDHNLNVISTSSIEKISDGWVLTGDYWDSPMNLMRLNNHVLYFNRTTGDSISQLTLNVSDGTAAGTLELAEITSRLANLGYLESPTNYYVMTSHGLVFQGWDSEHGNEPWISDGTVEGTHLLVDLVPGASGSDAKAFRLNASGIDFVGMGTDGMVSRFDFELTTNLVTSKIEMMQATQGSWPESSGYPEYAVNYKGKVVFKANDGLNNNLYISDGSSDGTQKIISTPGRIDSFQATGGFIYAALVGSSGAELWKSDGTPEGSHFLTTLDINDYITSIREISDGERSYLLISNYSGKDQVLSDGTALGTRKLNLGSIKPIESIISDRLVYGHINEYSSDDAIDIISSYNILTGENIELLNEPDWNAMRHFNGLAYFYKTDWDQTRLLLTDGTVAGTTELQLPLIDTLGFTGSSDRLVVYSRNLNEIDISDPIWYVQAKGSNSFTEFHVNEYLNGGRIESSVGGNVLLSAGEYVYFLVNFGDGETARRELWRSNGTGAGTTKIISPDQDQGPIETFYLTAVSDIVFISDYKTYGYQVMSDGRVLPFDYYDYFNDLQTMGFAALGVSGNNLVLRIDDPFVGDEPFAIELESRPAFTLQSISDQSVNEFQAWSVQVYGNSAPARIAYQVHSSATGLSIDTKTGLISWTPSESDGGQSYSVTVTVQDQDNPDNIAETSFTINVNEVNTAHTVAAIPKQTLIPGQTWKYQVVATDDDQPSEKLTYALGGTVPVGATIDPATGEISWAPGAAQSDQNYTFDVQATDSGSPALSGVRTVVITVLPVNHAPIINAIAPQTATVGQVLKILVNASDPDAGQSLSYSLASDTVSGVSINSATGEITVNVAAAGNYSIVVQATDNGVPALSATTTIQLNVLPPLIQVGSVSTVLTRGQVSGLNIMLGNQVELASASQVRNYKIVKIVTRKIGKKVKVTETNVALRSAKFDPATGLVTLTPTRKFALSGVHQLRIDSSKILDNFKRQLDGDRDGAPGGLARYSLSKTGGTITASSFRGVSTRIVDNAIESLLK